MDQRSGFRARLFVVSLLALAISLSIAVAGDFIQGDMNDDEVFDIADSVVLRRALAGLGPGITQDCVGSLLATGQTICWDSVGRDIPCSGTGHDGEIQAGATLAYVDNGDGTITDLNTGLMWEKKSDDGTIHDWGNVYDWDSAVAVHVAGLNDPNVAFAGYVDWRMPKPVGF